MKRSNILVDSRRTRGKDKKYYGNEREEEGGVSVGEKKKQTRSMKEMMEFPDVEIIKKKEDEYTHEKHQDDMKYIAPIIDRENTILNRIDTIIGNRHMIFSATTKIMDLACLDFPFSRLMKQKEEKGERRDRHDFPSRKYIDEYIVDDIYRAYKENTNDDSRKQHDLESVFNKEGRTGIDELLESFLKVNCERRVYIAFSVFKSQLMYLLALMHTIGYAAVDKDKRNNILILNIYMMNGNDYSDASIDDVPPVVLESCNINEKEDKEKILLKSHIFPEDITPSSSGKRSTYADGKEYEHIRRIILAARNCHAMLERIWTSISYDNDTDKIFRAWKVVSMYQYISQIVLLFLGIRSQIKTIANNKQKRWRIVIDHIIMALRMIYKFSTTRFIDHLLESGNNSDYNWAKNKLPFYDNITFKDLKYYSYSICEDVSERLRRHIQGEK